MLKDKKLLKVLTILIIFALGMLMLTGCGSKKQKSEEEIKAEYSAPIKNYMEGIKSKNIDQIKSAFPEFKNKSTDITSDDVDDLYRSLEETFGANVNIEYTIGDGTTISDDEINDIEEDLEATYPDAGEIEITKAYLVPVTIKFSGDKTRQSNDKAEENVPVEGEEANQEENAQSEGEETKTEENVNTSEEDNDNTTEQNSMYVFEYNGNWYTI